MSPSTLLLPLLLLLVTIASASHFWGGSLTFTPKGRNADGSFRVEFRLKKTFDSCYNYNSWNCYSGDCGSYTYTSGTIYTTSGRNADDFNWCQTEGVMTRNVPSNRPFEMSVPQNCARTYYLMAIDPDNDQVRCRYGIVPNTECNRCSQHSGFHLNQASCTLHYGYTSRRGRHGFELVLEDFPRQQITLSYTDGSRAHRGPLAAGRRRYLASHYTTPSYPWWHMPPQPTHSNWHWQPTTTTPPARQNSWWWWHQPNTTPSPWWHQPNTTPQPNTSYPWWHQPNTTPSPWWHQPNTTPSPWWWQQPHTAPLPGWLQRTSTTSQPPQTTNWRWWWQQPATPSYPRWQQRATLSFPRGQQPATPSYPRWQQPATTSYPRWQQPATPSYPQWQQLATPSYPRWQQPATLSFPRGQQPATPSYPWWQQLATPSYSRWQQPATPSYPWWQQPATPSYPWWQQPATPSYPQWQQPATPSYPWWQQPATPSYPWWQQPNTTPGPSTATTTATTARSTPYWWWQQPSTRRPATTPPTTSTTPPPTMPPSVYNTPLSKIPLQFVVLVDPPVPSCTEGMYLPRFLPPTPGNGERLHAAANQELEIRVKAMASHSMVDDVIISGPVNITRHRITTGEFVIRWTPIKDDLGDHFPICFIAKSRAGSTVYQSDMRCVIVDVGRYSIQANVICTENNMAVEVEEVSLIGLHQDHLRLNDPSCTLYSNGTHVLASMSLNTCGTVVEEDEESLIFRNEIVSFDDTSDVITRRHEVEIEFYCKYPKKINVTLEFNTHRPAHTFVQKGFGVFTYQFEFFDTDQFYSRRNPNSYPLEYTLGEMIYVQIESTSSLNNMELFAESCSATPYDDPNYHISYSIIENGCIKDETVQFYSNHESKVKFGMKAFKFIGLHEQVFVSCSVILCEAGRANTRCSQGCIPPAAAPSAHHHHRREAPIQTASHYISQGPLRLRRSADGSVAIQSLNLNLVFIAGCLLAAVAMLCGVVIYKTRGSKVKYQPLPTSEI